MLFRSTVTTHVEEKAVAESMQALNFELNAAYTQCLQQLASQLESELVKTAQLLASGSGSRLSVGQRYRPCEEIKLAVQTGVF